MLRSAASATLLLLTATATGCSGSSSPPSNPADAQPTASIPDHVDAGRGVLVLGGDAFALVVNGCSLQADTDPTTGVTTDVVVDAASSRLVLELSRREVGVPVATSTEQVVVEDARGGQLRAERYESAGAFTDLRTDVVTGSMITIDGTTVRAEGEFGPVDSVQGDAANQPGSLIADCGGVPAPPPTTLPAGAAGAGGASGPTSPSTTTP